MPITRVGGEKSAHPAMSPACVPPDDEAWTITSGATPCDTISATPSAIAIAPSGVDAPNGTTNGLPPHERNDAATWFIIGARSSRDPTQVTWAPYIDIRNALPLGRSGGLPFATM